MIRITCYSLVNDIGGNELLVKFDKGSIFLDFCLSCGEVHTKHAEFFRNAMDKVHRPEKGAEKSLQ